MKLDIKEKVLEKNSFKELSKNILCNENDGSKLKEVDEDCFANNNRLEIIINNLKNSDKNVILVFGINPAGDKYSKEYDEEYIEYVSRDKINTFLEKNKSKYINTNYFKSNYELFDQKNTTMSWVLRDESKLKEIFGDAWDYDYYKKECKKDNILVFCDLIYYHETTANKIKKYICKEYEIKERDIRKLEIKNEKLNQNVKKMIDEHIKKLNPKLIVVTNALASQLIYCALNGNGSACEINYKNVPILFAGMVSGAHTMDKFSKERLKRDIKKYLRV